MNLTALMKTFFSVLLVFAAMVFADDEKVAHDYHRVSFFAQPAISFLNFDNRKYFQDAVDTIYREFYSQALTESESLTVAKQDFQKVNFCFPITGGIQFQPFFDHFISLGFSFIYDHESVVLTDRRNKSHNYNYTIQGAPLFLEYRLGIPKNLISLTGESLFSVAVRWYWVLPGTEIYSTWGKIDAKTPIYGGGWGISLGYLLASWKGFNIFGDIGYTSIPVKSNGTFKDIVPDGPEERAKWDIGGLQMQFRISFGFWDYPKFKEDSSKVKGNKESKNSPLKNQVNETSPQKADTNKVFIPNTSDTNIAIIDTTKNDTTIASPVKSPAIDTTDSAKVDTITNNIAQPIPPPENTQTSNKEPLNKKSEDIESTAKNEEPQKQAAPKAANP